MYTHERAGNNMISLIIPVYNVEKYLRKCLLSVKEQTFQDYEVVIVNDGSTDHSADIIREFAAADDRIKYFEIPNGGVGNARNYGVRQSKGEYICFLDSDDYMEPDCLERLINTLEEKQSDIAICNNYDVDEDGNVLFEYKNIYSKNPTSLLGEPRILFNRACPWGKLFKSQLFDGMEFVCNEIAEDVRLIPKLYYKAEKIAFCDKPLINYVQRKNSLINGSGVKKNLHLVNAFNDLIEYFSNEGIYEHIKDEMEFLIIDHIAIAGITRAARADKDARKDVLIILDDYLQGFEGIFQNPYIKEESKSRRLILFLNKHHFYWITRTIMNLKSKIKGEL